MTPHERFPATMHFKPVDRAPLWIYKNWQIANWDKVKKLYSYRRRFL